MAMDDIYRLAKGIVLEGEIARPAIVEDLVPYGPWARAKVVDTSLYINHKNGFFFGNVRYILEGEKYCNQASFNELWMQGWTSVEFMKDCIATQGSRCGGSCGGFVQEGAFVHAETCTGKKPKAKPAAEEWTLAKLVQWASKRIGSKDPDTVRASLTVEGLHDKDVPSGAFDTLVKYRHLNNRVRLQRIGKILSAAP